MGFLHRRSRSTVHWAFSMSQTLLGKLQCRSPLPVRSKLVVVRRAPARWLNGDFHKMTHLVVWNISTPIERLRFSTRVSFHLAGNQWIKKFDLTWPSFRRYDNTTVVKCTLFNLPENGRESYKGRLRPGWFERDHTSLALEDVLMFATSGTDASYHTVYFFSILSCKFWHKINYSITN